MVDSSITNYVLLAAHLIVGFLLVFFAAKAFKRTKYPPMALLAIGFTLEGLDESYYKSLVSGIEVKFRDGEMSCKLEKFTMDEKIQRLWEKFSEK